MNNSVVYLHACRAVHHPRHPPSDPTPHVRSAEQNIQFTANYRVRILITTVLYFTSPSLRNGEYSHYDSFIWIKARVKHKLTKIYTLFWVKNISDDQDYTDGWLLTRLQRIESPFPRFFFAQVY